MTAPQRRPGKNLEQTTLGNQRERETEHSSASQTQYSDRTRLAYQYRRGEGLDDDTDVAESFTPIFKFMSGFESQSDTSHSRLSFNFDRLWIYVHIMPTSLAATPPALIPLECEIPFEDIVSGGLSVVRRKPPDLAPDDDRSLVTLTVTMRRPARFYATVKGKQMTRRATERDFVFSSGPYESIPGRSIDEMEARDFIIREGHAGPIEAVPRNPMTVNVNTWLTWQFRFLLGPQEQSRFRQKILELGLTASEDGLHILANVGERKIRVLPPEPIPRIDPSAVLESLEFRLRFLVEGLVGHGIVVPSELSELVQALDKSCSSIELKERVLTALYNEKSIVKLSETVAAFSKQLFKRRVQSSPHQLWVFRCVVTPTRICLFPPELESSSNALRKFRTRADRFLRVQFADEGDRIQINPFVIEVDEERPAEGTIARVRRALNSGLSIAGRRYVFLTSGSLSPQAHTCWFLAPDLDFSVGDVRRGLGYENIADKVVGKHSARQGIPFSTSLPVNLKLNVKGTLPDVFTQDEDKICFTDGVGRCGVKVAHQTAREFGVVGGIDAYPSAIQIRCGGIKGVLGVWPELCDHTDVAFRPSQIKFATSTHTMAYGLNCVRTSQFHRGFLNRQFVLLMSHLGVSDHVIERLFRQAIRDTRGLERRFREGRATKSDMRAGKGLSAFPIKELAQAGFHRNQFFSDCCKVLEGRILSDYKWKARIEVQKSVYMLGIADEVNVLKEGEVFCQYENPAEPGEGPVVVQGTCAVMRAPALHPGDVRLVTAVDHPRLRHLKNVVVFSVQGVPLPNLLSGGDLDGDHYTLIWDERLLPTHTEPPGDYTPPKPIYVNSVTEQDVKDFFIYYLKHDILGQVSTAHMAHADRFGPQSEICKDLANLASIAVDFPTTGVPAIMHYKMRPKQWPTFMGKDIMNQSKNNYESRQILGKLFKLVDWEPIFNTVDIRDLDPEDRFDKRMERYSLPESILDNAFKLKRDYDTNLLGLMKRYRLTEAETVSAVVLRNIKRRGGRESDIQELVAQYYKNLSENVLEIADRFLAKRKLSGSLTPRQIYGIAAYQVTYVDSVRLGVEERVGIKSAGLDGSTPATPRTPASPGSVSAPVSDVSADSIGIKQRHAGPAPLISFPWVFWEALVELPLPNLN